MPRTIKVKTTTKTTGLSIDVLNIQGEVAGQVNLPKEIFDAKINPDLMAQAVRVYLANQRQGTQSTKTRGEVSGTTAKMYRQKGTGRARHGAKTAPIFVGGGISFGPKPRDFSLSLPKKMKKAALFSALTEKFQDGNILVVAGLDKIDSKTKVADMAIKKIISQQKEKQTRVEKILLILPENIINLERACQNLAVVKLVKVKSLNTFEVLNHERLIFVKESISVLEQTFLEKKE